MIIYERRHAPKILHNGYLLKKKKENDNVNIIFLT
jgi:hypothetical protein